MLLEKIDDRRKTHGAAKRSWDWLPFTKTAFDNCTEGNTVTRGMVWQSNNAGPLTRILTTDPDFRVLIVDDYPAMRSLTRSVLISFGIFNIEEATSGAEGLDCIRKDVPNIAIVDYELAPMTGLEFIRRVRLDPDSPNPSLPIMMMTGVPSQRHIFEMRDAGVTDIITKPFAPNTFVQHIVAVLENVRKFIQSAAYCGPDRRCQQALFRGMDRRCPVNAGPEVIEQQNDENIFWV